MSPKSPGKEPFKFEVTYEIFCVYLGYDAAVATDGFGQAHVINQLVWVVVETLVAAHKQHDQAASCYSHHTDSRDYSSSVHFLWIGVFDQDLFG